MGYLQRGLFSSEKGIQRVEKGGRGFSCVKNAYGSIHTKELASCQRTLFTRRSLVRGMEQRLGTGEDRL